MRIKQQKEIEKKLSFLLAIALIESECCI